MPGDWLYLKFKEQVFQTHAVESVADCFAGQPKSGAIQCRVDPGRSVDAGGRAMVALKQACFKNAEIAFAPAQLLENVRAVQRRQDLSLSDSLASNMACAINLDIEMETGTGKTVLPHQEHVRAASALWLEQVHRVGARYRDPRGRIQVA